MKKWQCQVCGYIHKGPEPPDNCPVCGADKKLFDEVAGSEESSAEPDKAAPSASPQAAEKKWRCTVCGYIHTGPEPPDKCPVCGADKKLFEEVTEDASAAPKQKKEEPAPKKTEAPSKAASSGPAKKWRCTVCGYVHTGPEPPDKCPVCGADKKLFEEVTEDAPATQKTKKEKPAPQKTEAPQKAAASGPEKKWRCSVCGYIHTGPEPPDKCPVCGADKSQFVEIIADSAESAPGAHAAAIDLGPVPEDLPGRLYHLTIGQMLKHHAHPVSVHVPNGVIPFSFIFILLAAFSGCSALEIAAQCNMIFVVLALPFVIFSGYIEWQKRYKGAMTDRFVIKIICAAIVAVSALCVVIWWLVDPDVLSSESTTRWAFILTNAIMLGAAGVAGLIGGKFVFKD